MLVAIRKVLRPLICIVGALTLTTSVIAAERTLIEMQNDKPVPALASSWKKVKDGQYEFVLDTSKEIRRGTPLSTNAVKNSLEARLGATLGLSVSAKNSNTVVVNYKGSEQDFLKKVATTRIREARSIEVASENSSADAAIRARTAERPTKINEVKVMIISSKNGQALAKVIETKSNKIKNGQTIRINIENAIVKPKDKMIFVPKKLEKGAWTQDTNTTPQ